MKVPRLLNITMPRAAQLRLIKCMLEEKPYRKTATYIEKTENFDFGGALLTKYDILVKILSYLPFKDLTNVAEISELWANSVDDVLRKRQAADLFTLDWQCYKAPESIWIKPSFCMLFQKVKGKITLSTYLCIHSYNTEIRKPVIEFVESDLITRKCPIIAFSCKSIASSFTSKLSLHGIIFPTISHIKTSLFCIRSAKQGQISATLDTEIGQDHDVLCLLVYTVTFQPTFINDLITEIQYRQPDVEFTYGGGSTRGIQVFNTDEKCKMRRPSDLWCIAYSKPKNINVPFNAYSILIPCKAKSKEAIETYFLQLKDNYVRRQYGIAFRTTCVSRINEVKYEMELFKKYFPDIEIIGFNGDGEMGIDNISAVDKPDEPKKGKYIPKYFHFNSTVILLLAWGREKH